MKKEVISSMKNGLLNDMNGNGCTELMHSIIAENKDEVERLSSVFNFYDVDKKGRTSLIYACLIGNIPIVEILIEKHIGAINMCDYSGKTPLMYACINNDLNVVKLLIENGADPDIVDKEDNTAFIYSYEKSKREANEESKIPSRHVSLYVLENSKEKERILDYSFRNKDKFIMDYMLKKYPLFVLEYTFSKNDLTLFDYVFGNTEKYTLDEKLTIFIFANEKEAPVDVFKYLGSKDIDFLKISYVYMHIQKTKYKKYKLILGTDIDYDDILNSIGEFLETEYGMYIKNKLQSVMDTEVHQNFYSLSDLKGDALKTPENNKKKNLKRLPNFEEDIKNKFLEAYIENTSLDNMKNKFKLSELEILCLACECSNEYDFDEFIEILLVRIMRNIGKETFKNYINGKNCDNKSIAELYHEKAILRTDNMLDSIVYENIFKMMSLGVIVNSDILNNIINNFSEDLDKSENIIRINKTAYKNNDKEFEKLEELGKIEVEEESCFKNIAELIFHLEFLRDDLKSLQQYYVKNYMQRFDNEKFNNKIEELMYFTEDLYVSSNDFLNVIVSNFIGYYGVDEILNKFESVLKENEKMIKSLKSDCFENISELMINFSSIYRGLDLIKKYIENFGEYTTLNSLEEKLEKLKETKTLMDNLKKICSDTEQFSNTNSEHKKKPILIERESHTRDFGRELASKKLEF